jgi:polyferredoxin
MTTPPTNLPPTQHYIARGIAGRGGFYALFIVLLFWLSVWIEHVAQNSSVSGLLLGVVYWLYVFVLPILSVLTIGLSQIRALRHEQPWSSALLQSLLSLASIVAWQWSFTARLVEGI